MAKRLALLVLVLSLAAGVLAGTPVHSPSDNMPECCKRANSGERSSSAEMARLCCAVNCAETAPISSGSSFNPAPAGFILTYSANGLIEGSFSLTPVLSVREFEYIRNPVPGKFKDSYIKHQAFLI